LVSFHARAVSRTTKVAFAIWCPQRLGTSLVPKFATAYPGYLVAVVIV
jgi:hypothetical protein